ncbi:hypothetical protein NMA510612_0419 [Neisseria meningitidis]|uniref:Uncharacterized protein n=2 Tax=Neisseria meningitidis TaxID=487 RepID=E0NBT0_NEIM3|nr:hypothetical protein NMA510612_0419 [Neisseria meningitidis]EFM03557.1 hypothetical protein HMPREF0602_1962 [Neisseria meningitidis ATCC 13091]
MQPQTDGGLPFRYCGRKENPAKNGGGRKQAKQNPSALNRGV